MIRKLLIASMTVSVFFITTAGKKNKNESIPTSQNVESLIDYKLVGSPLPQFSLKEVYGKHYNNDSLPKNKAVLLMLFNPTCGHCEDQSKLFLQHPELWEKVEPVFVFTNKMQTGLGQFFKNYYAKNATDSISIYQDESDVIKQLFEYKGLPQINLYNKEKKLIKTFAPGVHIDTLKKYLD